MQITKEHIGRHVNINNTDAMAEVDYLIVASIGADKENFDAIHVDGITLVRSNENWSCTGGMHGGDWGLHKTDALSCAKKPSATIDALAQTVNPYEPSLVEAQIKGIKKFLDGNY